MSSEKILKIFADRRSQCVKEKKAYELWLDFLTPLRWVSIIVGVVLPAVAGVTYFSQKDNPDWALVEAILLLVSGVVSALHTGLHCDAHQADCRRLVNRYAVLSEKYHVAVTLEEENEIKLAQENLETEFLTLLGDRETTPARWCYNRAEQLVKV